MPNTYETPKDVTIKYYKKLEETIDDCHEYTIFIKGNQYKRLPLDANVREPDVKKSKPYKDMIETLSNKPENFFENNLGISIIANDVKEQSKNKLLLTFNSGTGILNGGHTQQAILDAQQEHDISSATIKLMVKVKEYSSRRIAEIATAQNSCTGVKEYSLAEKLGLFAKIKKYMDDDKRKHIIWYEGCKVSGDRGMNPQELIAILNVFNIMLYTSPYSEQTGQPTKSATSPSATFKRWETIEQSNTPEHFDILYPLINDILDLYELILRRFHEGSNMTSLTIIKETAPKPLVFSNGECTYGIPKQMLFPILAAYRANIWYEPGTKKIGWCENNEDVFNKYNKELCQKLRASFKANGNQVNRLSKDPAIWENLYVTLRDHIDKSKRDKIYEL
ncbi:AIPR protein [Selenomonas sp. WCT3]|uniref:AIPR family protein n=1 Tax=Selenomonas sp. WCT3 TaxID=3158785 RepID=UPI00088E9B91|nr:AIPR protein [Selenomonas ruminantium]